MDCTTGEVRGGWCEGTRLAAAEAWPYAMMAALSYKEAEKEFALPGAWRTRVRTDNDPRGFAYSVFDKFENGKIVATAIAFRGTEFNSFEDWWYGNLWLVQNRRGRTIFEQVRKGLDDAGYAEVPIYLAGHSLGGAIATYSGRTAVRPDVVEASETDLADTIYAFNSSPRDGWGGSGARRRAINERGEILAGLRSIFLQQGGSTLTINCAPGFRIVSDHSMAQLADCLTWIAAYENDASEALRALGNNPAIVRPATQSADDEAPAGSAEAKTYVPVNVHYFSGWTDGVAVVETLHQLLREHPLFEPVAKPASAYAIHLIPRASRDDPEVETINFVIAWTRNFDLGTIFELTCKRDALHECLKPVIEEGETYYKVREVGV
ncbi:alpha/beta hydrolase family protein [Pseudoblastomonas halimionae]|uniref:DUF2974 domain-containing protein n=1 Tax=Alteriqipengyuania halimionae TaxID=1926630 RepID=A0A6I4U213_9SPHN|nr:hypothetical protein [Alteriqipengyuania halimionae]MXP10060.1 hypothetical protein [Alteriqipengyuania halimionae]